MLALGVSTAVAQDAPPVNRAGATDSLAGVVMLSGDSLSVTPAGLERVRRRIAAIRNGGVVRQIVYPIIVIVPQGADSSTSRLVATLRDQLTPVLRDSVMYREAPVVYPNRVVYQAPVTYRDSVRYGSRVVYPLPVVYEDTVIYRGEVVYRDTVIFRDTVVYRDRPPLVAVPVPGDTAATVSEAQEAAIVEQALLQTGLLGSIDVVFAFDGRTLMPATTGLLNTVGSLLSAYPGLCVEVTGHTDSTGPEAYNQRLSEQRAEVVRQYLLNQFDLAPGQITTRGMGEAQPIAGNETSFGRTLNRRVTFRVLPR
jgi:outer membrane protein OmpA-like peptidoglycan-associated protein